MCVEVDLSTIRMASFPLQRKRRRQALAAFEDPTYTLVDLKVESGRPALAYIWPDEHLPDVWQLDRMVGEELDAYLDRCAAWRERYAKNPD